MGGVSVAGGQSTPERYCPTRLVVVQATPFCNIDCSYCYLGGRSTKHVIEPRTIDAIVSRLQEWGRFPAKINVVWHAGEPLVLAADFYADAFRRFDELAAGLGRPVLHAVQTNATLATDAHADLFAARDVAVGVSLDGPKDVHDAYRRTRRDTGTYEATVRGLRRFQQKGLGLSALAVISRRTLRDPLAFYESFESLSLRFVGMNVLEKEGANASTFELFDDSEVEPHHYAEFLRVLFRESLARGTVRFRELARIIDMVVYRAYPVRNSENRAGSILSFTHDGRVSTYSPELLGFRDPHYGDFGVGNVETDAIADSLDTLYDGACGQEIRAGVARCEAECDYQTVCGGGSPANKLGEHRTFKISQTRHCNFSQKVTYDVAMEFIADPRWHNAVLSQASKRRPPDTTI